ncbi:hypothetical protein PIB30_070294, partial [Stylosanthes scabra]|nr:hypothetical protein [Stylosanthes scabra]
GRRLGGDDRAATARGNGVDDNWRDSVDADDVEVVTAWKRGRCTAAKAREIDLRQCRGSWVDATNSFKQGIRNNPT